MGDQFRYDNGQGSIPAYQVLDDLEAANGLDSGNTMMPFEDVPQMGPYEPQPMPGPQGGYPGPQQMGYAEPQSYGYNGPQRMPQQMQMPAPQQYGYSSAPQQMQYSPNGATKFCKFCAAKIPHDAVICTACGRQVEMLSQPQPAPVVINNNNENIVNAPVQVSNVNNAMMPGLRQKDKWVAFILCLFFGVLGIHKFYEGRVGLGLLYLFTGGLCGIGVIVDLIMLILKPNPYYV